MTLIRSKSEVLLYYFISDFNLSSIKVTNFLYKHLEFPIDSLVPYPSKSNYTKKDWITKFIGLTRNPSIISYSTQENSILLTLSVPVDCIINNDYFLLLSKIITNLFNCSSTYVTSIIIND